MKKKGKILKQKNIVDNYKGNKLYNDVILYQENTEDQYKDNLIIKPAKKNKKTRLPKLNLKRFSKKQLIAGALAFVVLFSGTFGTYAYMKSGATKKEEARIKKVEAAASAKKVDVPSALRKGAVKRVKKQKVIPAYSLSQIKKMNMSIVPSLTVSDLKLVTSQNLVGLEASFLKAGKKYGVNPLFLIAIASLESANGTICFKPNNMFGYGSKGYSSKSACIYDVAKGLGTGYLNPKSGLYNGKRISDVNKRYASSSTWDIKVANNMYRYYRTIHNSRMKIFKKI